jgi:hypothetical protein
MPVVPTIRGRGQVPSSSAAGAEVTERERGEGPWAALWPPGTGSSGSADERLECHWLPRGGPTTGGASGRERVRIGPMVTGSGHPTRSTPLRRLDDAVTRSPNT